MKTYETVTILKPQLTDGEVAAFVEKAKAFISSSGGEVVRRFSHDIAKNREGFYLYLKFKAQGDFVKKWNDTMRLNQNVLRTMVMSAVEHKIRPAKQAKTPAAA